MGASGISLARARVAGDNPGSSCRKRFGLRCPTDRVGCLLVQYLVPAPGVVKIKIHAELPPRLGDRVIRL
jgi:hypothetical protein